MGHDALARYNAGTPGRRDAGTPGRRAWIPLSVLAALLAAFLFIAPPAGAQTTDYDANDNNLIEIDTPAKLNAIRHDPDGDGVATNAGYTSVFASPATGQCPAGCTGYELTADLDLSTDYSTWSPIATYNATLNGNGYAIRGLNVNATGTADAGLFGTLDSSAVVRQLGIIEPRVQTQNNGGGIAGKTEGGSFIDASYVQGGGIVLNDGITNIGGLVGTHEGHIRASYATAACKSPAGAAPATAPASAGWWGCSTAAPSSPATPPGATKSPPASNGDTAGW